MPMVAAATISAASLPLRIVSLNIRYAASSRETNELPWWTVLCVVNHDLCRDYRLSSTLGTLIYTPPHGYIQNHLTHI